MLALVPEGHVPPETAEDLSYKEIAPLKMEYDVLGALERLGHEVRCLDVRHDLGPIREVVEDWKPRIVFNMLEEFHGQAGLDQNVVGWLELMRVPYTGCNPRGLFLARDKALAKKILQFHRVRTPRFAVVPFGRQAKRPRRLDFPLFVKSLVEDASAGIAQASVVRDDEQLAKRVAFVHEGTGAAALVEQYVEGRELYLGVLGNRRLQTFPLWELVLDKLPDGAPRVATARVKFDVDYQERYGITTREARDMDEGSRRRIVRLGKRIYRALSMSGYARIDLRLREDGEVFFLEANPNPDLSEDEDFSSSAAAGGLGFDRLIARILSLGLRYEPML